MNPTSAMEPLVVAIIGGGASGTLVAMHLLQQQVRPVHVYLFERRPQEGGVGTAYGTRSMLHLLNVPAAKMSALPNDPAHFHRFLEMQHAHLGLAPTDFAPRMVYGQYLSGLLQKASTNPTLGNSIEVIHEEVVALKVEDTHTELRTAAHRSITAEKCVLALGNFTPGNVSIATPSAFHSERYIGNPWRAGQMERIHPHDRVLMIGTGLTTVDLILSLTAQEGRTGSITAFSRHGEWPTAHAAPLTPEVPVWHESLQVALSGTPSLTEAYGAVKQALRRAGPLHWRQVIDAIRPNTQRLWHHLSEEERARFHRHLNHRWAVARHRMPGHIAAQLAEITREGRMQTMAGRLLDIIEHGTHLEALLEHDGKIESHTAEWIVNCTGPYSNYDRVNEPLVQSLRAQNLIATDALHYGICTDAEGHVLDAQGQRSNLLYTLGPPMKSMLFECTAMPEITVQAQALAALLTGDKSAIVPA